MLDSPASIYILSVVVWQVSNTFHFTFSLDPQFLKDTSTSVRRVLPATEEEARGYLARYDADHRVKHPTFTR